MEGQVRAFLASLESQLAYSPSTCLAYGSDLRCFTAFLQKELGRPPQLTDFNARQAADFLLSERKAGKRYSTLLRRRASLRSFANFLSSQHSDWRAAFNAEAYLIDQAVAETFSFHKTGYLSQDQIQSLWEVLGTSPKPRVWRDQAILALLLEKGLSVGALIALSLADLNLQTQELRLFLKPGQEIWLPLSRASGPIQHYLEEGRPELNYLPEEPALFISQTGNRMSRQGVWQVLRKWGNRANLSVSLSPRLVRHTAARKLAQEGRPIEEIQALLGHSNPLSTQALLRRLQAASNEEIQE